LLQSGLNDELKRSCQFGTVRSEDQLQQAAAEVWPIDAFAGTGQQKLLDHVAYVIVVGRGGRPATLIEMKWIIDIHRILV